MAAALPAADLGPDHPLGAVLDQLDGFLDRRLVKARPTSARLELGGGIKEDSAAAGASVGAVVMVVDVLSRPGAFGPGPAQDLVLIGTELGPPLVV